MFLVWARVRLDFRNRKTPSTGSCHQKGMSAKRTTVAMTPPKRSVVNPRRERNRHDQIKKGNGKNQPVNLVAAAQPRTSPKARLQAHHPGRRGVAESVSTGMAAWANSMIARAQ